MPKKDSFRGMSRESMIFAGTATVAVAILILAGILLNSGSDSSPIYVRSNIASARAAVCPGCGQQGTPLCINCRSVMAWNGQRGLYACPGCQAQGAPFCPSCMRPVISQYRGAIGCVPPNPGLARPQPIQSQNGLLQAA